ncbi:hypothetical protein BSZ19_02635 [Bradyrhizobium japonicum]|uniref:Uncharacterized protein n=1 Tax=Bradyrhizobium japonicum TaxID=375 RepID=A0A1Y2JX51_BRAJP|nr:hypothetical protein [Bradyrhizobium japonicum]OSJ36760.1 hypothetical protein BSZ19_02635 [Bradyrhizobium japonicum]
MENLFIESPACRAQLFSALDRVTNLATESYQDASTALPEVAAPSIAPDAVAPLTEPRSALSNAFALAVAVALACVAAFFSIAGMAEIFPGAPVAVMVLAGSLEAGKLIIAPGAFGLVAAVALAGVARSSASRAWTRRSRFRSHIAERP